MLDKSRDFIGLFLIITIYKFKMQVSLLIFYIWINRKRNILSVVHLTCSSLYGVMVFTGKRMRRPRQQTKLCTPDQPLQHTPDQTPPQTPHTLQNIPHQTPRQTPEPNTENEFSRTDNDVWKVGSMHHDGRLQVKIIRGV